MQCVNCGAQAHDGQRFCGNCGKPLATSCPNCGHENPGDHRFCGACGTSLTVAPEPPAQHAVPAVERRVVSVAFLDLVGFTSFSEERDPEDVRALITRYFDLARDVIDRFGGTIDKFIGDAVMAWWGATTSNEDDAERAVRACLELVDRVERLGREAGIAGLAARAGVMTGEVSVGPGGNERGLLLGDLVNIASRVQTLAEPGTVFVGETTAHLVGTAIDLVDAGTHQVKGRDQPVTVSRAVRVTGERGGRGRTDILEPPFVGRVAELRLLKDALDATGRERRARLVSLVGQAGIGKSRLIWEFQKYVDGLVEDVFWHEGRSPAYGDGVALWALGEMIRRRVGVQETDDDLSTAERLEAAVARYVEADERGWVNDRLATLLGIGEAVAGERTELFAAARAFFEGIAEHGSTVLVFEDLHWADPSLLEFIDEFTDWSHDHPILIVTLARPDLLDHRPDWGTGRRGFSSSHLGPLADDEMRELILGAMPGLPAGAVDLIVEAAGGVPLFAVEMLRMLIAEGRVSLVDGTAHMKASLEDLEVPSTVQAVVSARLDRLPPEERDLARDAAVLGQSFPLASLAALREEQADKLERRMSDLVRREIFELVRDPRSPERGQYRWVQSVLREVAYARIARTDRVDLHLRVARHLRELDDVELAPVVASHFVAASEHGTGEEVQSELAAALRAAIDRAQALHSHEQILSLVEVALPVVSREVEADLREVAALAALRIADFVKADAHVDAMSQLAKASQDITLAHRAAALAGRVGNESRRPYMADEALSPHLAVHTDWTSDENLARAAVYLARTKLLVGDEATAASLADDALGAVEKLGMLAEVADALVTRGTALARTRTHQAMALLRGALALCREHDLADTKLRALININYASPDVDETLSAAEEAFEEAKRLGDRTHASFVAGNLAGTYIHLMRHDAGEAILRDPVLSDAPADRVNFLMMEAELFRRRGDHTASEERLAAARALTADVTDPQSLLATERAEATSAIYDGRFREAYEIATRHVRESPFALGISVSLAVASATLEGDLELISAAAAMAEALPPGPIFAAVRETPQIVTLVLQGEIEAGMERLDALVGPPDQDWFDFSDFLLLVAVARHLPIDHPARDTAVARVKAIAEASSAPGLSEWIVATVG